MFVKELKKKKALQASDSFHALCANTVKPTSEHGDRPAETAQRRPPLFQRQRAGPNPGLPKETPRVLSAGEVVSGLGSIRTQRPASPPLAAPSSILFILQQGDLAGKVNFPSASSILPVGPAPLSPIPQKASLLVGKETTRERPSERSQSTGLTMRLQGSTKAGASPARGPPAGRLPASSGFPRRLPSGHAARHRR